MAAGGPWAGTDGALYVDGTELTYVDEWSTNFSKDEIEITSLGASSKEYIAGLSDASVSCSGKLTDSATFLKLANQVMTVDNDSGGSSVSAIASAALVLKLYAKESAAGGSSFYIVGSAITSGMDLSQSDVGKWSYNGRLNNASLIIEGE